MRLSSCAIAKVQKLKPWCLAAAEVGIGQGLSGVKRGSSVVLKKYQSSCSPFNDRCFSVLGVVKLKAILMSVIVIVLQEPHEAGKQS